MQIPSITLEMHFMSTITFFTSAAAAFGLKGWRKPNIDSLKISEAQAVCGPDTTVRCCNKGNNQNNNNNNNGGFFGLTFANDLNLFNSCIDLSLDIVGILDSTLGRKCSGNVVCCRNFPFAVTNLTP